MHHAVDPMLSEDSLHGEPHHRVRALGIPDFVKDVAGVGKGIVEGAADTVNGVVDAVTNPVETAKGVVNLVTNPDEAFPAMWDAIKGPIEDDWKKGNQGEAIGRGIFGVAEVIFGAKGLTKLGKAGKAADAVPDASRPDVRSKPDPDAPDAPRDPEGPTDPGRPGGDGRKPVGDPEFPEPAVPSAARKADVADLIPGIDPELAAFAARLDVAHVFRGGTKSGMHHVDAPGQHGHVHVREIANPDKPYVPGTTWRAKVGFDGGGSKTSTMYPREWSREDVLVAIREAERTVPEGSWRIKASNGTDPDIELGVGTHRGIEINIQRNQRTGEIITAYPREAGVAFEG